MSNKGLAYPYNNRSSHTSTKPMEISKAVTPVIAGAKALAESEGMKGVMTQIAEAIGLTHVARKKKAVSLAVLAQAYGLPANDADVVMAMAEQALGLSPEAAASIRRRLEREQDRLQQAALEVAKQVAALPPSTVTNEVDPGLFDAWTDGATGISDERVREVWAKVLLQEAGSPGSVSKKSLSELSLFSRQDADALIGLASARIQLPQNDRENRRWFAFSSVSTGEEQRSASEVTKSSFGASMASVDAAVGLGLLREKDGRAMIWDELFYFEQLGEVFRERYQWKQVCAFGEERALLARTTDDRKALVHLRYFPLTKLASELIGIPGADPDKLIESLDGRTYWSSPNPQKSVAAESPDGVQFVIEGRVVT